MRGERDLSVWIASRPRLHDESQWGMRPRVYAPYSSRVPQISAVYLLLDDALAVLYIGKTTQLEARLFAHWKADRVPFTRVVWRQVHEPAMTVLEAYLIGKAMPTYNRKFCASMASDSRAVALQVARASVGELFQ